MTDLTSKRAILTTLAIAALVSLAALTEAQASISYTAGHGYDWEDSDLSVGSMTGTVNTQDTRLKVKADHLTQIADAINDAASKCGAVSIWSQTDLNTLSGIQTGSPISKAHLNVLRKGIRALYTAKGQILSGDLGLQTDIPQQELDRISKFDIQNMRLALDQIVSVCSTGAVCGNGATEVGEQCDDGNILGGDGCSATCQLEPNMSCSGGMVWDGSQCACISGQTFNGTQCVANATCTQTPVSTEMPFGQYTVDGTNCVDATMPGLGTTLSIFWNTADCNGSANPPMGQMCVVPGSRQVFNAHSIGCGGNMCLWCGVRIRSTQCGPGSGGGGGGGITHISYL